MPDVARARSGTKLDKPRLRRLLGLFFVALAIPTAVLVYEAYGQLKWEAFYQHRVLAEEFADRIDVRLRDIIAVEEARSSADYRFLVVQGEPSANFVQRSPLAGFPVEAALPGLMAYFQVDNRGTFSTPLLPVGVDAATYGLSAEDVARRARVEQQVRQLLIAADTRAAASPTRAAAPPTRAAASPAASAAMSNAPQVAPAVPPPEPSAEQSAGQAVFDRLDAPSQRKANGAPEAGASTLGKIADLKFDSRYDAESKDRGRTLRDAALPERASRKEQTLVAPQAASPNVERVMTFESELDPFVFRRLDAGHFVLFRKVWLNGERLIQGAVIAQDKFIEGIAAAPFRDTTLSRTSDLIVGYQGQVVDAIDRESPAALSSAAAATDGELLYRTALSAPLNDFELIFSVTHLPVGPGGRVIGWATLVLGLVLAGGFWVVYRFAAAQIDLSLQQQDFVSAVSHELKTPLTSIRMYGEILRAGWADEQKKQGYYDFIYHESERLSRLINNVLRLARLTRNGDALDRKPTKAAKLLNLVESKVATQVEQAGFTLRVEKAGVDAPSINVDADSIVQILINLVDNAVKFSARADVKIIELGCRTERRDVVFWVRDYGPGVPKGQMKKIFRLFYRAEGELTRETVGTGIGLALVHELTTAMGGSVRVRNRDPGAEFSVAFPVAD